MYVNNRFFFRTGMYIGGIKTMDTKLNDFNLVFFWEKENLSL
jgi:hypothetical protein